MSCSQRLQVEALLHSDETGINVNGENIWLATASSNAWTLLSLRNSGGEAMMAIGILENFKGILCVMITGSRIFSLIVYMPYATRTILESLKELGNMINNSGQKACKTCSLK